MNIFELREEQERLAALSKSLGLTDEEHAAIVAAVERDADEEAKVSPIWGTVEKRFREIRRRILETKRPADAPDQTTRAQGRPPKENPKVPVSLRLDPDVVAYFKATGPGWQSRINDILRRAIP